jgi:putative transposase
MNINRSSYYKLHKRIKERKLISHRVRNEVVKIKSVMPNIGGKKIHKILEGKGVAMIGRDKLFSLLRSEDLLVHRKRKYAITTDSNHPFKKYKNLIKGVEIKRVNQVWVSDITYLRYQDKFCYLSLITDVYSRKIVGYHVNTTLELEGTMKALKEAYKHGTPEVHHSDRGSQYCSYRYTRELKKKEVKISMTEDGNCYENAIAERINGILKNEFNLNTNFTSIKQVKKATKQAIEIYNAERPHWALGLQVPNEVFLKIA